MELRHLRYFIAVAEEGQVTRAAQRLGIKQPPLTQQIQMLERELGVELFTRTPRKVELNAAGRMFLAEARSIVLSAEDAVARLRQFDKGIEGVLRVGLTSSSLLNIRSQALFDRFRRNHPHISLKIEEGAAVDLLGAARDDQLDVVFIRAGVQKHAEFASQWLTEEELVVAVPTSHGYAESDTIALPDLQRTNLILYRQDKCSGIGEMLLERLSGIGLRLRVADETRRLMSAIHMVAAGIGITIVPDSMRAFRPANVIYKPLRADSAITAPLNLVYRRDSTNQVLREFLLTAASVSRDTQLNGSTGAGALSQSQAEAPSAVPAPGFLSASLQHA